MRQPALAQRRWLGQRACAGSQQEHELRQQQLLEREPLAALACVLGIAREVHRSQRAGAIGQALARAQRGRQRLIDVVERGPLRPHEREDLGRADALRSGVVSDRRRALLGPLQLAILAAGDRVVHDAEAAPAIGLAVQQQGGSGLVALHQPGLVEEGRAHAAAGVGHGGLHERAHPSPPHGPAGDRPHPHRDRRLLAGAERDHRARLAAVTGQMLEQLADRVHAERAQRPRHPRGRKLERPLQARRTRPAQARAEQLLAGGRARGGKRAQLAAAAPGASAACPPRALRGGSHHRHP